MSTSKNKNSKRSTEPQPTASRQAETDANSSEPIFFWRPHESWGFLGQWYDSPFKDGDTTFTCAEQYMMYHKALTFDDAEIAQKILETTDPREHKSLGQKVSGFTDKEWNRVKFDIVVNANLLKFGGDVLAHKDDKFVYSPDGQVEGQASVTLRELLSSTGERELVEASPRDKIWGVGFSPEKAGFVSRAKWGQNLLGKALTEVRMRLREEDNKQQQED